MNRLGFQKQARTFLPSIMMKTVDLPGKICYISLLFLMIYAVLIAGGWDGLSPG